MAMRAVASSSRLFLISAEPVARPRISRNISTLSPRLIAPPAASTGEAHSSQSGSRFFRGLAFAILFQGTLTLVAFAVWRLLHRLLL